MTLIILIACIITVISGAALIGVDYEPKRTHTKKPRPTKRNTRLITGRINSKGLNAIRRRTRKSSTISVNKTRSVSKEKSK